MFLQANTFNRDLSKWDVRAVIGEGMEMSRDNILYKTNDHLSFSNIFSYWVLNLCK